MIAAVDAQTGTGAHHRAGIGGDIGLEQGQRQRGHDTWRFCGSKQSIAQTLRRL